MAKGVGVDVASHGELLVVADADRDEGFGDPRVEQSLRRLGTDYVDAFMPHFPDGVTPVAEILAGFDDLIRAGRILHGGLSSFPAWRVASAATRAEMSGLAPWWASRPSTAWLSGRPSGSCCRWPRPTG